MSQLIKCECGGEAVTAYNTIYGYQAYCTNTECPMNELIMENKKTEAEAIEAWNRRVKE